MYRVEWTDRGIRELETSLSFIEEESPGNGRLVKQRVDKTLTNLGAFSLGLAAPKGTFRIYVPKTSYFLIFRRDQNGDVKICGFVHAARDWERIDWENL